MTEPAPTGRDLQRELALLAAKNERLSDALLAAREQIVELKRQVDDLAKPPGTYAVFLGARPDGSVDVISAGRKMHVGASPAVDLTRVRPGQEVMLNEALTVVEAGGYENVGEIVTVKELLGRGRALVVGRGDEERVVRFAGQVTEAGVRPGTTAYADGVLEEGFGDARRPLILFGAGHVGRALVLALAPLPFAVTWIDPRPDAFPAHVPGNVTLRRSEDPAASLPEAPAGAFVLVMTHSHPLDLALVGAALGDTRFPYVGLIGSATKRARFEKRLAGMGIPAGRVASLVCPIGIAGIDSKLPAVIAAATAAELLVRDEALRAAMTADDGLPVRRVAG